MHPERELVHPPTPLLLHETTEDSEVAG